MRKFALVFTLAAMLVATAAAQTSDRGRGTGDLYVGYAHLSGDVGKNGWNAAGTFNFNRHFGLEGDFGGYYGKSTLLTIEAKNHEYSFMAGPKMRFRQRTPSSFPGDTSFSVSGTPTSKPTLP